MARKASSSSPKRKPQGKKKPVAQTQKEKKAGKQIWAIVLFAVGILLGFLTYIEGNKIWKMFHNLLFGLFGWGTYFITPLAIYIAVMAATDKSEKTIKAKLWQSGVLLLFISGTITVFKGLPHAEVFFPLVLEMFKYGILKEGGGVLGLVLAGPLSFIGTSPIPQIVILIGLFVFIMLVTGSTLLSLYYSVTRPVKTVGTVYSDKLEERKARQNALEQGQKAQDTLKGQSAVKGEQATDRFQFKEKEEGPKFDIDVDISEDHSPEEFAQQGEKPLEPTLKDMAGATLNQPNEVATVEPEKPKEVTPFTTAPIDPALLKHQGWAPRDLELPPSSFRQSDPLEAQEHKIDPMANFGVDSPVEYVTLQQQANIITEELPTVPRRPHPLDEDIKGAREEDILRVVQEYLGGSVPDSPSPTPEVVDIETFKVNVTQPLTPIGRIVPPFGPNDSLELEQGVKTEVKQAPQRPKEALATGKVASSPVSPKYPSPPKKPSTTGYHFPPLDLLEPVEIKNNLGYKQEMDDNAEKLVKTLESFGVKTKIIGVSRGPAVTRYELQPSPGVKISRITGLADDIALNLAAAGIRIEAPIPNKAAVGIEVPNKSVDIVRLREVVQSAGFENSKAGIGVALGKDITGNLTIGDITSMPHMLIAGATGSGKSVCINALILSILYKYSPNEVKLLLIDPKVVELGVYNGIPHLLVPVVTEPKKAAGALSWAVVEMIKRYQTFADHGVRDIKGYLKQQKKDKSIEPMPQVVIVIDELADLMMAAPNEVEDSICRLAQMARAAGMHLVIATQRPSVDVITGVIKANIPSRIAFSVSSQVDSRTILDMGGAEKLLGRGDMLFYPMGAAKPLRVQGCFVTDAEVNRVVDYVKSASRADYDESVVEEIDRLAVTGGDGAPPDTLGDEDEYMPYAIETVVEAGQASTSLLQRRLKIGYNRAANLVDQLEHRGIIGPFEGSRPRDLLISKDQYLEMKLAGLDQPNAAQSAAGQQKLDLDQQGDLEQNE